jgi:hypothetical protein
MAYILSNIPKVAVLFSFLGFHVVHKLGGIRVVCLLDQLFSETFLFHNLAREGSCSATDPRDFLLLQLVLDFLLLHDLL